MRAGLSAVRQGLRLWGIHLVQQLKIVAVAATGVLALSWLLAGSLLLASLLAAATGMVILGVTGRCPADARRWIQGGLGERRTASTLAKARWSGRLTGWRFMHDLSIPGSKANLDHVAVHPSGRLVVYLDTKAWHAKNAKVRVSGTRLKYGPWDKTDVLHTVQWEASKLRASLDGSVEVVSMLVCDGTQVENGVTSLNGTYIVQTADLVRTLRKLTSRRSNRHLARDVKHLIGTKFPSK